MHKGSSRLISRVGSAIVMVLAVALLCAPASGRGAPRVLITIDVESNDAFSLPEQIDAVCDDGAACGLMEIGRMLRERGWGGTFFLNVYEHRVWGEVVLRDIAVKLQNWGQDVALHTHPQWSYDPTRNAMWQYNLQEQTAIIRDGAERLRAWTGRPVVAHRAGDYAADERTLEALERNGIFLDSSLFWGHPRCQLTGLGLPRNLPAYHGLMLEIPVTIYRRDERPHILGDFVAPVSTVRKIDPAWFLSEEEANAALDAVIKANPPFIVVFLHSFSFLKQSGSKEVLEADRRTYGIFRAILDRIGEMRLQVVTMRDVAESRDLAAGANEQDQIPAVAVQVGIHRYFWHRLREEGVSGLILIIIALIALIGATAIVLMRRRVFNGRAIKTSG